MGTRVLAHPALQLAGGSGRLSPCPQPVGGPGTWGDPPSLVSRQAGLGSRPQNPNNSLWYSPFKSAFLVASSSGALHGAEARQGSLHLG